jgi:hypothetical protein
MDMLTGDFEILHQLKRLFKHFPQPSYERYTNLDEMVKNVKNIDYPMGKTWNHMCQFLKLSPGKQGESNSTRQVQ